MSTKWRIFLVITFLALVGCKSNLLEPLADDSSHEAQLEDARMALNDGDYQKAIDILEPGYSASTADPETSRLLASAYMGKAGIDLTYLLENSDSGASSFDIIASMLSLHIVNEPNSGADEESLSSSPRYVDPASIECFMDSLEQAQVYLSALVDACADDDDVVQLGMVSVVHFVLEIGMQAADAAGVDNIPVNRAAYQEIFPNDPGTAALLTSFASAIDSTEGVLPALVSDMNRVKASVVVIDRRMGADEDIAIKFNEFLTDILGSTEPANLTGTLIKDYVSGHLLAY